MKSRNDLQREGDHKEPEDISTRPLLYGIDTTTQEQDAASRRSSSIVSPRPAQQTATSAEEVQQRTNGADYDVSSAEDDENRTSFPRRRQTTRMANTSKQRRSQYRARTLSKGSSKTSSRHSSIVRRSYSYSKSRDRIVGRSTPSRNYNYLTKVGTSRKKIRLSVARSISVGTSRGRLAGSSNFFRSNLRIANNSPSSKVCPAPSDPPPFPVSPYSLSVSSNRGCPSVRIRE